MRLVLLLATKSSPLKMSTFFISGLIVVADFTDSNIYLEFIENLLKMSEFWLDGWDGCRPDNGC